MKVCDNYVLTAKMKSRRMPHIRMAVKCSSGYAAEIFHFINERESNRGTACG